MILLKQKLYLCKRVLQEIPGVSYFRTVLPIAGVVVVRLAKHVVLRFAEIQHGVVKTDISESNFIETNAIKTNVIKTGVKGTSLFKTGVMSTYKISNYLVNTLIPISNVANLISFAITVMLVILIQTAVVNVQASTLDSSADSNNSHLPSITAVIRRYNIKKPELYSDSWVSISPHGMRVTDLSTESEVVKNFKSKQVWLANKKRKIQHEVDVEEFGTIFPDLEHVLLGHKAQSNLVGNKPCAHWDHILHGDRIWRGNVVQEWICKDDSGFTLSKQLFDPRLGIVVRVEHAGGDVEALLNIMEIEFDGAEFMLGEKYNDVTLAEILTGRKPLDSFAERAEESLIK